MSSQQPESWQRADYARRTQREPATGSATLSWEAEGVAQVCPISLRNLTADGMQAVGPRAVSPGAAVFVSGERYECAGEVRYCIRAEDGYCFGLRFRSDPYPPPSAVRPN